MSKRRVNMEKEAREEERGREAEEETRMEEEAKREGQTRRLNRRKKPGIRGVARQRRRGHGGEAKEE